MDKFTIRGIIYSTISALGLGYELFFVEEPRPFLIIMYSLVIGIGFIYIFMLRDSEQPSIRDPK